MTVTRRWKCQMHMFGNAATERRDWTTVGSNSRLSSRVERRVVNIQRETANANSRWCAQAHVFFVAGYLSTRYGILCENLLYVAAACRLASTIGEKDVLWHAARATEAQSSFRPAKINSARPTEPPCQSVFPSDDDGHRHPALFWSTFHTQLNFSIALCINTNS